MIKGWPGWVNYFALFAFYFLIMMGLNWLGKFHVDWRFVCASSAFYSGGYLSKWVWVVTTLPDGSTKTEHRFW